MIDLADALMPHLIAVPILLPLVAACVLMLLSERRHRIKATFGLLATIANLGVSVMHAGLLPAAVDAVAWSQALLGMALAVTGGGGLALIGGMLILGHIAGSYELSVILSQGEAILMRKDHPASRGRLTLTAFARHPPPKESRR